MTVCDSDVFMPEVGAGAVDHGDIKVASQVLSNTSAPHHGLLNASLFFQKS